LDFAESSWGAGKEIRKAKMRLKCCESQVDWLFSFSNSDAPVLWRRLKPTQERNKSFIGTTEVVP